MKKIAVLAALLMLPVYAFGAVGISVVDTVDGDAEIDGTTLTPGATFQVDIVLSVTDGSMVAGTDFFLKDATFAGTTMFTVTGATFKGTGQNESLIATGWNAANGALDAAEDIDMGTLDNTYMGSTASETLYTVTIQTSAAYVPPAGEYVLTIGDSDLGAPSNWLDATTFGFAPFDSIGSLTITPEPTSALLLLAALPFIRRRK